MFTRPCKAETALEFTDIDLPCIASRKLDGYRCMIVGGNALSTNFKPIRNIFTRETLRDLMPDGMDGELMLRNPEQFFSKQSSAFSAYGGSPDFVYNVFDYVKTDVKTPYEERLKDLEEWIAKNPTNRVQIVPYQWIRTMDELVAYEAESIRLGYEGSMFRKPSGKYKSGRSTMIEKILLKMKRWVDSEAVIVGFKEGMSNTNAKEVNEFGLTKRSSKKAGKVPSGRLGTFIAVDPVHFPNSDIKIGGGKGLTQDMEKEIFENQAKYMHKIIKYKYQKEGGEDLPRFAKFHGFRELDDMDQDHPIIQYLKNQSKIVESAANSENESEILGSFFE